jgi:hypothetical protein
MVTTREEFEILNLETIAEVVTLWSHVTRVTKGWFLQWQGEDIGRVILLVFHADTILTFISIDAEIFHTIDFRCLHQLLQVLLWQVKEQFRIREVRIKLRDSADDLRVTVVEGGLTLGVLIIDHNLLVIREEESGSLEK